MKKIFKIVIFIAIILTLIISGVLIYLNKSQSSHDEDPSSSIWLTKEKSSISHSFKEPDNFNDSDSADSSIIVNNSAVSATNWYQSAYYSVADLIAKNNFMLQNDSALGSSSSILEVTQYYNVYLLSNSSLSDVPKAYITSVPSDNISDPSLGLTNKIKQLRNRINSYNTWTSGTEKLSTMLACYNLQKYSYADSNIINTLFYKINNYRSNNSLKLLEMNSRLQLYAMERAVEIAWIYDKTGKYSSLDANGETADTLSKYSYESFSENLAFNGSTANDVFNIWTNLDFSRNSMLSSVYNYAGLGVAEADDGTLFWVIMYVKK